MYSTAKTTFISEIQVTSDTDELPNAITAIGRDLVLLRNGQLIGYRYQPATDERPARLLERWQQRALHTEPLHMTTWSQHIIALHGRENIELRRIVDGRPVAVLPSAQQVVRSQLNAGHAPTTPDTRMLQRGSFVVLPMKDGGLQCLDLGTAEVAWQRQDQAFEALALTADMVLVRSPTGRLQGIDLRSGTDRFFL